MTNGVDPPQHNSIKYQRLVGSRIEHDGVVAVVRGKETDGGSPAGPRGHEGGGDLIEGGVVGGELRLRVGRGLALPVGGGVGERRGRGGRRGEGGAAWKWQDPGRWTHGGVCFLNSDRYRFDPFSSLWPVMRVGYKV